MTQKRSVSASFPKPGANLLQLRNLLASLDGAPGAATVECRIYFGGGIKSVTVEWEDPVANFVKNKPAGGIGPS